MPGSIPGSLANNLKRAATGSQKVGAMNKPSKFSKRLTIQEEQDIMFFYLCTDMKVLSIAQMFDIDRKTLYRVINKFHHPIRKPYFKNPDNHPTNFNKSLRRAAQDLYNQNIERAKEQFGEGGETDAN